MVNKKENAHIAHRIPGRIRIKLPGDLNETEMKNLVRDLKVSPEVKRATLRGSSLIIEHSEDREALTVIGSFLHRLFPDFERFSDELDAEIAKAAADPWINKSVPLAFLGLAIYRGLRDGAILAGESAFALAYIGFDIYWKFQQENIIRKIQKGLSQQEKEELQNAQ